jgi:hypothetical protein
VSNITTKTNPFSDSRVDTPFQHHSDLKELFADEFQRLNAIITDIKNDVENHQSKGAIVIGEPGAGKTHLMMRLANERLQHNRLLFIRQPNNLNSVLYHIYSRVLESFVQKVPNSSYCQLEHLLATSFYKIIQETFLDVRENKPKGIFDYFRKLTDKDRFLLKELSENPLNIYTKLGEEGARKKREYWQRIETLIDHWWKRNYGDVGYATAILNGIVKFCSYSDTHKKKLVGKWLAANELDEEELKTIGLKAWKNDSDHENFSLDAMTVFGKLSIMDEPLIIIFDQLEALGLEYNQHLLQSFGDTIKELFTYVPNSLIILNLFPDRWEHFKDFFDTSVIGRVSQCQIHLNKPPTDILKKILVLKAEAHNIDIKQIFTQDDINEILAQESIREVLNRASHYFRFRQQGIPLPSLSSIKTFEEEIKEELRGIRSQLNLSEFEKHLQTTLKTLVFEVASLKQLMQTMLQQKEIIDIPSPTSIPEIIPAKQEKPVEEEKPLIITAEIKDYLEREKAILEQEYEQVIIISDSDDLGKLSTIIEAFNILNETIEIGYLKLGKRKLPEHLLIKMPNRSYLIGFLNSSDMVFPSRIKNFNTLVEKRRDIDFTLFRDSRETTITGKAGTEAIEQLNKAPNGQFIYMDKDNRLTFELIYKLIVDIQNKDFEADLASAIKTLDATIEDYWLMDIYRQNCSNNI